MPAPVIDWITPMNGEWIIPTLNGIWSASTQIRLADQGDEESRDISGEVVTVPSRESKVVIEGATHNLDGTINGRLTDFGGVTAKEYLRRLHALLSDQRRYRIIVVKRDLYVANARFHTSYRWRRVEGTDLRDVTLTYAELT